MSNPPTITQISQYLKDMSFENFAADAQVPAMPGIDLNVNVDVRPIAPPQTENSLVGGDYETTLNLRAAARPLSNVGGPDGVPLTDAKPLFLLEIAYAGRYRLTDVPQAEVEPFLAIEVPRLLFPFLRQIAAEAVTQGGLPPMLIAPIDFAQVYQQQKNQTEKG